MSEETLVPSVAGDGFVLSYLGLRRAIGVIGIGLPFALAAGAATLGDRTIEPSISAYYYTPMRDVLVGSLCAIAIFMMSYRGYDGLDNWAGNIACVFALGVALFPGTPPVEPSELAKAIGKLHLASATGFLVTLALFPLVLFRRTDPAKPMTPRKRWRNHVYLGCGVVMVASLLVLWASAALAPDSPLLRWDPVFWFEALAVFAFGVSWLTKGEALLAD